MHNGLLTITSAWRKLRSGELTSRDLVERCLERVDSQEEAIGAWVAVYADEARRQADRLDGLAVAGEWLGPLHGVPMGIKDIVDIAGYPTLAGSPLRTGHVAQADAEVVTALEAAGAILLGKTVTTEFACFDPPRTRNPWNLHHSPGGSSSGSAAAVATGMCLGAVGSQTGGSIIRPASFCGVAGFKPSHALVSGKGVVPLSYYLDHVGPIGLCAEDLLLMLSAMGGFAAEQASRGLAGMEQAGRHDSPPFSFLRFREHFEVRASEEVRRMTDQAIDSLRRAGAVVEEAPLPPAFQQAHAMHRRIMAVGAAQFHQATFRAQPEAYSRHIRQLVEDGLNVSALEFADALDHQRLFRSQVRELLAGRIALMPATASTAPTVESTGDPSFQSPWSLAGLPAGVVPCGAAADGLPCGLQFLGAEDLDVLTAMRWAERFLPPLPALPQNMSSK